MIALLPGTGLTAGRGNAGEAVFACTDATEALVGLFSKFFLAEVSLAGATLAPAVNWRATCAPPLLREDDFYHPGQHIDC